MIAFGSIGFTAPWLLLGLFALPLLWLLLRALPPAPVRRRFPGVVLLLGLRDDESIAERTPWWLLLLRAVAAAAMIVGFAGPVLNPQTPDTARGPLLVVLDAGWAGAAHWRGRMEQLDAALVRAARAGRSVALLPLTAPDGITFQPAEAQRSRLASLAPEPFLPDAAQIEAALDAVNAAEGRFDTIWLDDGLAYPGRESLVAALRARGDLHVVPGQEVLALAPPEREDGVLTFRGLRTGNDASREVTINAEGRDPGGTMRRLATTQAQFGPGEDEARAELSLPRELAARVTRFSINGARSAGAVVLADDGLAQRKVALVAGREGREALALLSPLHFLEQALAPDADLLKGPLHDMIAANPDVVVLADVASLPPPEAEALREWVEAGGVLLRFAGPRLAASEAGRQEDDPLLPVRLRSGGRSIGGAMSWGEPRRLAPFAEDSPFAGLTLPDEVTVSAQVLAEPGPDLSARTIAALADETPLVTRKALGKGRVVLFHVTANAEWSSLPLSGLFVEMLDRLAISAGGAAPGPDDLAGTVWQPLQVMDGFGMLSEADTLPGVDGAVLATEPPGPDLRPGLYAAGDRRIARNVLTADAALAPSVWPRDVPVQSLAAAPERPLGGVLLALALGLLVIDVLAALALSGRLRPVSGAAVLVLACLLACLFASHPVQADEADDFAARASGNLALAHVLTGDSRVDDIAQAGLMGLSDTLFLRTSVEPAQPIGVDLETDELAFFPMLYWPIIPDQPRPSREAYSRLNDYLRNGGLILFDTRDADVADYGSASPNGRKLRELAAPLDIPPLEPLPRDHVLTRSFYLLQDFPGRHNGRDIWVEAATGGDAADGMPFRNLNDGVTPVVIGGNDWAAAWAVDRDGRALVPVGRGSAGERQREMAYRFGVNLVMHVLTGNYKSDQVHVPALLERLGQ
ncbi:DUF4159 domain-containing protein [Pontibaca methylaminivorans]|uniref:DUF4159 domain-containing protein n=1 Tax=Pontibaca methylaminivorans TaxID=515897 RepID=UPI002FD9ED5D